MNTLKKCILLGILILNLIPYMQNGKVKWTTTEAGAQYYTIEPLDNGKYLCGVRYLSNYSFESPFECNRYNAQGNQTCSNVDNIDFNIQLGVNTSVYGEKEHWCVFYCLEAIVGGKAKDYAVEYYKTAYNMTGKTDNEISNLDLGVDNSYIPTLYVNHGVQVVNTGASGVHNLLTELYGLNGICSEDKRGLLQHTYSTKNNEPHVVLMYCFQKNQSSDPINSTVVFIYDTDSNQSWTTQKNASAIDWYKTFDILQKD